MHKCDEFTSKKNIDFINIKEPIEIQKQKVNTLECTKVVKAL